MKINVRVQQGNTISGEVKYNQSGYLVVISVDSLIAAVGAY